MTEIQELLPWLNAVLLPAVYAATRSLCRVVNKLLDIERRISHIEGKLGITDRKDAV